MSIKVDRSKVNHQELDTLKQYFRNLCTDLTIYQDLFTREQAVTVLNRFSSLIFARIQQTYIQKLCLSLACLFDPEQTGKNKNLSLQRLVNQCDCNELTKMYDDLVQIYDATGIRDWRNKVLAHNDLGTLLGTETLTVNLNWSVIEHISEKIQEIFGTMSDPHVQTDIRNLLPADKN